MSVKVTTWVWHDQRTADLKGNGMLAMLALADIADDEGVVVFSSAEKRMQPALARKARMSVATFRRAVDALVEDGLLEVTRETQRSANAYRILLAPLNLSAQTERSFEVSAQSERSLVSGHSPLIDIPSSSAPKGAAKGTRLSPDWVPLEALLTWAKVNAPSVDVVLESGNFVDYWVAIPGARGIKLDWDATWRTWMRRAHQRNVDRGWRPVLAAVVPDGQEWLAR